MPSPLQKYISFQPYQHWLSSLQCGSQVVVYDLRPDQGNRSTLHTVIESDDKRVTLDDSRSFWKDTGYTVGVGLHRLCPVSLVDKWAESIANDGCCRGCAALEKELHEAREEISRLKSLTPVEVLYPEIAKAFEKAKSDVDNFQRLQKLLEDL